MKHTHNAQPSAHTLSPSSTPPSGTGVPPVTTPSHSSRHTRRANVIILAVGALAVLAVVALSYSATVRVDRAGAVRAAAPADGIAAANLVVEEIGALLAADLFGNKIVTPDVPRLLDPLQAHSAANPRIWPAAFEDGDYSDYPFIVTNPSANDFTHNLNGPISGHPLDDAPNNLARLNTVLVNNLAVYEAGHADDGWLSSTEPFFDADTPINSFWPQITNLRGAYRWRSTGTAVMANYWARDDGRFADLGQWFIQNVQRSDGRTYANPSADLSWGDPASNSAWTDAISNLDSGPQLGVHDYTTPTNSPTRVFGYQMNGLHLRYFGNQADANDATGEPSHADTRFWADADGDLRPDSRWQELELLRGLNGMRWLIAARIVDNSALVNVNTATEFGSDEPEALWSGKHIGFGVGETPADVDLLRLLREAFASAENPLQNGAWGNIIITTDFAYDSDLFAYDRHVSRGRGLFDFLTTFNGYQLIDRFSAYGWASSPSSDDWRALIDDNKFHLRTHRTAAWTFFASSTLDPLSSFARRYTLDNEIALRTYWASNDDRVVSDLESRLDYLYIPGDTSTLPNQEPRLRMAGPLRSARPTSVERSYEFIQYPGQPQAEKRPSVFDVRDDTRRLLTTVSGVSDISPIPVLNDALDTSFTPSRPVFDRFVNRKVRIADFASTRSDHHRAELIRDAFEAFVWALAPLATNQPLWRDAPHSLRGQEYHYGGGLLESPAQWYATQSGLGDPFAAYAVLRAASLTVNLATAANNSGVPAVVRLFNNNNRAPGLTTTPPAPNPAAGVVHLGTRFSHGDIFEFNPGDALPTNYVGQPANGVTLVGLDRQPFLREVYTLAVYQHHAVVGGALSWQDNLIDPISRPNEQLGSIFAVELGNPWPESITISDYEIVMIDESGGEIQLDISSANVTIEPGERHIFWAARANPDMTMQNDHWRPIEDHWIDEIKANLAPGDPSLADAYFTELDESDLTTPFTSHVIFQEFDTPARGASVLLVRNVSGTEYLIDRISPDADRDNPATRPFPARMDAAFDMSLLIGNCPLTLPPTNPQLRGTGRLAIASILRRASPPPDVDTNDNPAGSGFPCYVIERPEYNIVAFYDGRTDPDSAFSATNPSPRIWRFGRLVSGGLCPGGGGPDPQSDPESALYPVDIVDSTISQPLTTLGVEKRGAADAQTNELPQYLSSFQFFVPNGPLLSTSELFMLSAFAHTYVHLDANGVPLLENIPLVADPNARGPGTWRTVSEQLGENAHFFYDAANTPDADTLINPWLGVLDPSRFIFGSAAMGNVTLNGGTLADHMTVPLAVRVLDAFEGMPTATAGGLTPGRINVNTAPVRVLRTLPFISPEIEIETPAFAGGLVDPESQDYTDQLDRAWLMANYRDTEEEFGGNVNNRRDVTYLDGLRTRGYSNASQPKPGFVSIGELPLLARWNIDAPAPQGPMRDGVPGDFETGQTQYHHFAEAAIADPGTGARANTGQPDMPMINVDRIAEVDGLLDLRSNAMTNIDGDRSFDPVDDAEERMAIFRAVSNIVSTRSDVFTAWFIVRAYDPNDIASIRVDVANPNADQIAEYMEQLPIAHESRWLAVFDRSNISSLTDRPRLLLLTQLPK